MLILECSQKCYRRTDGRKDERKDGSVTISLRNFVGEEIITYVSTNDLEAILKLLLLSDMM